MKKILLLSTIYPIPKDNKGTKVCHYFAKEWKNFGYDVHVVHIQAVYPKPFYWVAKFCSKTITAKTAAVVYTNKDKGGRYSMDGVPIIRYPLFKYYPHAPFVSKEINKMITSIIDDNAQQNFVPDMILGHFVNPCFEVVSRLKDHYQNAVTGVIIHLPYEIDLFSTMYKKNFVNFEKNIDTWGFRSIPSRKLFESKYGKYDYTFNCFSGIPETMIIDRCEKTFSDERLSRFIYVGDLIQRKYPLSVLKAIHTEYNSDSFYLTYVGDGGEKRSINNYILYNQLEKKVVLTGKIIRESILKYLDDAECFIMISKGEAFGLVYLEAMARGCITIASRNEGVDGIIQDGMNGFLCEAGNSEELAKIIKRINSLHPTERKLISENAISTVKELTDKKVAMNYINEVLSLSKSYK